MVADSDFLKTLQDKEAELVAKLEQTPIWKQIAGIRSTIELFRNGEHVNGNGSTQPAQVIEPNTPLVYPIEGTWGAKILFALNVLISGYVEDIIAVLKKHETFEMDDDALYKRISQNCSVLKADDKIEGVKTGMKVKYYRK